MMRFALALMLLPSQVLAGDLFVDEPVVPLAPPGAMAHAAYFTLTNNGTVPRQLIGVSADGYMMAHVHKTEVKNDVASMLSVDLLEIAPGQSVDFERGGLHIMLMRPNAPLKEGNSVELVLEFANGETMAIAAKVVPTVSRAHLHGS